ncbi:MAG: LysR family transcriptional regulator [Armatimonadota bacterium]|nr:LysR family transcriptional regulator [Armatimonadota bacterium]MDR7533955.1 LysR family transcriptional regulator [Armatimonadota bacterium]MDR7536423.1 LysR family transcriptional regulator [Armatimonadota bacterium]
MEISQVEAFLAIATFGSFRRAAESLNLTQPAVSARIKALERSLGTHLFERDRREGVTLSDAGRRFRPHAEHLLHTAALARLAIQARRPHDGGASLHVAAVLPVCTYLLPQALKRFRSQYPDTVVSIRSGSPKSVAEVLLTGNAEIGVARSLRHPDLETISLADDPLVLVGGPRAPITPRRPVRWAEIADRPFIFVDRGSDDWALTQSLFRRAGVVPNIALEVETTELAIRMTEYGMGLALLPYLSVAEELRRRKLVALTVTDVDLPSGSLDVVHRRRRALTPITLAFLNIIRETYAGMVAQRTRGTRRHAGLLRASASRPSRMVVTSS